MVLGPGTGFLVHRWCLVPVGYRGRFWKDFGILTKYGYFIVTTQIMLWKKYTWRRIRGEEIQRKHRCSIEVGRRSDRGYSPLLFGFVM